MNPISRRRFLIQGGSAYAALSLGACGSSPDVSSGGGGGGGGDAAPSSDDGYKALVAIALHGGNDAYNMIVPRESAAYSDYASARQGLALPRGDLLALGEADNGVAFGAHPQMNGLQSLFQQGRAAVLANVGTLAEPSSVSQLKNGVIAAPPRLFSHNDQSDQWQKTSVASLEAVGWAGRAADLLAPEYRTQTLPIGLSYSGANLLQVGRTQTGLSISTSGPQSLSFLRRNPALDSVYEALLANGHEHLFAREYARGHANGLAFNAQIAAALETVEAPQVSFPADRLGAQLKAVAQLIAAREALGVKRQIFLVGLGGFDTHADQLSRHASLMNSLSTNLEAFYNATEALGVAGSVTSFTISDFGRSLSVNGDGTDHGWSSHQLIVGGGVQGGRFYGSMPELALSAERDYGGGRFVPTTAVDQYGASLLRWFGVPASSMESVFPNIARFESADLGFMAG